MLKDSNGKELLENVLYRFGGLETGYLFRRYITTNLALFSAEKIPINDEPYERVLSQNDINSLIVLPEKNLEDKDSKLESAIS